MMIHKPNPLVPILETKRTIMRGHTVDDYPDSHAMWSNEAVVKYISGVPSTESESWERLLRYSGIWQMMKYGYWLVEEKSTGKFLGEVGFANYKRDITPSLDDLPEAGWIFAPSAHGKGFASEAVAEAIKWGDANLLENKTVCIFDPEHTRSIKMATKNGYNNRGIADYMGGPTLVMERNKPTLTP